MTQQYDAEADGIGCYREWCNYKHATAVQGVSPDEYMAFLARKAPRAIASGIEPSSMPDHLFDFQAACVAHGVRQGRAGLYLDTGLGKTRCQLEWAAQCAAAGNGRALIMTPLAVARQIEREGQSLGYDCRVIRDQSQARAGINIINYDRLDKIDADDFCAVSLDESSILKSFTGKTTRALIDLFDHHRFRLSATATPAPNDHMELGQQAEFLGIMPSNEMLMRWFVTDQTQMGKYRLKGHGEADFWAWMASWARMASSPEDLGFDGSAYVLPPLNVVRHKAEGTTVKPAEGTLFASDVSATNMHDVKRQTSHARADAVAGLVNGNTDSWVVWCDTDYEADALKAAVDDAVEVRGSMPVERKEENLEAFSLGQARVIITKPGIAGYGLNWQHCHNMAFAGRSFSYELWYQAVRRSWRFGQTNKVNVHIIVAEGEDQIGRVIDRKADDHDRMKRAMATAMRRAVTASANVRAPYEPKHEGRLPTWLKSVA